MLLGSSDRQVTVFEIDLDLIFLESRKIHIHLIISLSLMNIGLHQVLSVLPVKVLVDIGKLTCRETPKIIKQIFSKQTGHQHNNHLL